MRDGQKPSNDTDNQAPLPAVHPYQIVNRDVVNWTYWRAEKAGDVPCSHYRGCPCLVFFGHNVRP
jgi:hypothetical protein